MWFVSAAPSFNFSFLFGTSSPAIVEPQRRTVLSSVKLLVYKTFGLDAALPQHQRITDVHVSTETSPSCMCVRRLCVSTALLSHWFRETVGGAKVVGGASFFLSTVGGFLPGQAGYALGDWKPDLGDLKGICSLDILFPL